MTYNVQAGNGGYLGWKLLERTSEKQRSVFESDRKIESSRDYFSTNLPSVKSADDLIGDYRLITVALRAFGLDADIGNKAFIRKVLESDPSDKGSLVNRLTDKRYLNLNKAFALNGTESGVGNKISVDKILELYVSRSFEKNIGERYPEIELALNAKRELPSLTSGTSSETTKWYQIISSKPLRKVFEGALGLSSSFSRLPVERQAAELQGRFEKMSGDKISNISVDSIDKLIKLYLIKSQFTEAPTSPYAAALTILRNA